MPQSDTCSLRTLYLCLVPVIQMHGNFQPYHRHFWLTKYSVVSPPFTSMSYYCFLVFGDIRFMRSQVTSLSFGLSLNVIIANNSFHMVSGPCRKSCCSQPCFFSSCTIFPASSLKRTGSFTSSILF